MPMSPNDLARVLRRTHASLRYAMRHADAMHSYYTDRGFPETARLFGAALWHLTSHAEAYL